MGKGGVACCREHSNCEEECPNCFYVETYYIEMGPVIRSELSHLCLEGWTVRISPKVESNIVAAQADQASPRVAILGTSLGTSKISRCEFRDWVYEGRCDAEQVTLAHGDYSMEGVRLDGLRMTLPAERSFETIALFRTYGHLEGCMVSNVTVDAPVENFTAMEAVMYMARAFAVSDCLVSGISLQRANNLVAGILLHGYDGYRQIANSAVRALSLGSLGEGGTFCAMYLSMDWDYTPWETSPIVCSHVVLDVDDPLLSAPLRVVGQPYPVAPDGERAVLHCRDVYYTDPDGRFTTSDIWPESPDAAGAVLDGVQAVSGETLRSSETLAALNQPLEPGVDKTTGNRWSRSDDCFDGCPVPYRFSPYTPPAPVIPYGDVDQSGRIDASDALWILQSSVNLRELNDDQAEAADANGDYQINAAALQRSVALLDRLPMER